MPRIALVQLCSGDDPAENLHVTEELVRQAAAGGARLVLTPECTNLITTSRARQQAVLASEGEDPTLARLRSVAAECGVSLLIGSLALRSEAGDGRFANRSFLIGPDGAILARYDKIHMFDVELGNGERYREFAAYKPGVSAALAEAEGLRIGLSICYDLRFPYLYRDLAQAGATVLTVPSAFTVPTGRAHWHVLLRARAIETGAYVLAPAQSGRHAMGHERGGRETYGHSLAVDPWGEVLLDLGDAGPSVGFVDLDPDEVAQARGRIPALLHDRPYAPPS